MKSKLSIASFSMAVVFWLGVLIARGRFWGGVAGMVERVEEVEEALRVLELRVLRWRG